jgi:hypothetical protein
LLVMESKILAIGCWDVVVVKKDGREKRRIAGGAGVWCALGS